MKVLPLALVVTACSVVSCQRQETSPKDAAIIAAQKKQLEASSARIAFLERQVVTAEDARETAAHKLQANQETPQSVLPHRLDYAIRESSAAIGWLRAAGKVAKDSPGPEPDADLAAAQTEAKLCVDEDSAVTALFDSVRDKGDLPDHAVDELKLRLDVMHQNRQELDKLLEGEH